MQILFPVPDADGVQAGAELLLHLHLERPGHAPAGGRLVQHQEHEDDLQVRNPQDEEYEDDSQLQLALSPHFTTLVYDSSAL